MKQPANYRHTAVFNTELNVLFLARDLVTRLYIVGTLTNALLNALKYVFTPENKLKKNSREIPHGHGHDHKH